MAEIWKKRLSSARCPLEFGLSFTPVVVPWPVDISDKAASLTPLSAIITGAAIALFLVVAWIRIRPRVRASFEQPVATLAAIADRFGDFESGRSYVRESQRKYLVEVATEALRITRTFRWLILASSAQRKTAGRVFRLVSNSESQVARLNEAFVESELAAFGKFFDTVESKPLTPAQRRSCVVSEDSNLVLAGAGTGKTSTMIGRAGYLMASKRALPDQLLMLAFARKAAGEMQERLESRLKPWLADGVPTIKTFHALGLEIIARVEGRRPDITPMAEDQHRFAKFIDSGIDTCCDDAEYRAKIVRYFGSEMFPYRNPFDFQSMQDYYEYVRANELRMLKGQVVKSFEEVVIANFLGANGVNFLYEHPYKVDTAGPDHRQYKPDFYLPEYDVYIEHFALDRKGEPPDHFDKQKYIAGVNWKRELHRKHGTRLLETYSYQKREGCLESALADSLRVAGVRLSPKSDAELLEELRQTSVVSDFAVLLSDFLTNFKQSDHDLGTCRSAASQHIDATRLLLLLDLFTPVFEAYEGELARNGQIDFADMIRKATAHVESGSYAAPYSHILVDEFQDISRARARLVTSLIKQRSESVLFVVGDDWQSIYRFTGSDIGYTREFRKHFGAMAMTPLDTTFRFNDKIGEASSKFVLKNPFQIRKQIHSLSRTSDPTISLIRVVRAEDGLNMALDAIGKRTLYGSVRNATVLVLGRYNFDVDEWRTPAAKRRLRASYPSLGIDFMTVHSAKGKEADFVVVLGLGRGRNGFPSEKPTDSILEFLLPEQEQYPMAEERRLFYVALTRARHRVYLAYNPMEASQFVLELKDKVDAYPICTNEFDPRLMCAEVAFEPCPECRTGALVPRNGPNGVFVGCNNFPYCKHTEHACPRCDSLMRREGDLCRCTGPSCGAVVPICPRCKVAMVERRGPYGRFWGCINYRSNSDFVCTYTIDMAKWNRMQSGRSRGFLATRRPGGYKHDKAPLSPRSPRHRRRRNSPP